MYCICHCVSDSGNSTEEIRPWPEVCFLPKEFNSMSLLLERVVRRAVADDFDFFNLHLCLLGSTLGLCYLPLTYNGCTGCQPVYYALLNL